MQDNTGTSSVLADIGFKPTSTPTSSIQVAEESREELTLHYWAPVERHDTKDNFVCVQKLSTACQTCGLKITEEDATTSNILVLTDEYKFQKAFRIFGKFIVVKMALRFVKSTWRLV